jgi:putative transposase
MPRPLRIKVPNLLFHVINRGNARQKIFQTQKSYKEFLKILLKYKELFPIKIYHYILMPNHIHLLLEPVEEGVVSLFMQRVMLAHTRRYNLKNKSVGHVWQGRYKSILIDSDEYYLQCGRYIELNPVRAHLVEHPKEWQWSSFHNLAYGRHDPLVDKHSLYLGLGKGLASARAKYINFVESQIGNSKEGKAVRFSDGQLYGSDSFIDQMRKRFKIPIIRPYAGRPKNQT